MTNSTSHYNTNPYTDLIKNLGKKRVANFYLNEIDIEVYRRVFTYLLLYKEFENIHPSYSLNKGLLITGNIGVGKSVMMQILQEIPRKVNRYNIVKAIDIAGKYSENGYDIVTKNSDKSFLMENGALNQNKPFTICYDDLGTEQPYSSFYGNKINVLEQILLKRYDLFISHNMKTIITTNLLPEQIEDFYGARVRSRLKEMVNVINYPGIDRRK